jgi:hypothetical protein
VGVTQATRYGTASGCITVFNTLMY